MASRLEPMIIEVKADVEKANAEIAKLKGQLQSVADQAHKAASPMGKFKDQIMEVGKYAAAGFGLVEGIKFLGDSAHAAVDNQKSFALMATQLQNTAGATREQSKAIDEQLEKMSTATGTVMPELRDSYSTLFRTIGNSKEAMKQEALAQNIAAGTGRDLQTVSLALARAHEGNFMALNKMVPGIKNATDKFGFLEKSFKGMAETAAKSDPFREINASMEQIKVSLGNAILPIFQTLANLLVALKPAFDAVGKVIGDVVDALMPFIQQLLDVLMPLLPPLLAIIDSIIKVALVPLKIAFVELMPAIKIVVGIIQFLLTVLQPMWDFIAKLTNLIGGAFTQVWGILQKAMQPVVDVWNKEFAPALQKVGPWLEAVGSDIITFLANALAKAIPYIAYAAQVLGKVLATALSWVHDRAVEFGKFMAGPWGVAIKAAVTVLNPLLGAIMLIGDFMGKKIANFKMPKIDTSGMDFKLPNLTGGGELPPAATGAGSTTVAKTVKDANAAFQQSVLVAQRKFNDDSSSLLETYKSKVADIVSSFSDKLSTIYSDMQSAAATHASNLANITSAGMQKIADVVSASKALLTNAFRDATKIDAASMFVDAGANIGNFMSMLKDKLASAKTLAADAAKLAGLGYSQEFVQSVISKGGVVGDALAQQLIAGGADQAKQLQSQMDELNQISSHGVDTLASQLNQNGNLATEDLRNQYVTAQQDLVSALASENDAYAKSAADLQAKFDKARSDLVDALKAENDAYAKSALQMVRDYEVAMAKLQVSRDEAAIKALQAGGVTKAESVQIAAYKKDIASENKIVAAGGTTVTINTTNLTSPQAAADAVVNAIKFNAPVSVGV
jgi:phage-related protein